MAKPLKIFSGRESRYLAEKIAQAYGQKLGEVQVTVFSDGEFTTSFEENLRGHEIFIVQSTFPPTENLFELLHRIRDRLVHDPAGKAAHEVATKQRRGVNALLPAVRAAGVHERVAENAERVSADMCLLRRASGRTLCCDV